VSQLIGEGFFQNFHLQLQQQGYRPAVDLQGDKRLDHAPLLHGGLVHKAASPALRLLRSIVIDPVEKVG
jgi:hypothetical protein